MSLFKPCQGKSTCRYDHVRCLTFGRDQHEIERLRFSMDQLANLAIHYEYENIDEYITYIANKLKKSIAYKQQEKEAQDHSEMD